ncbi:NAD(P)-binding protein [Rhizodiscina lignyota]|uniref:NAD(P)-binding protein n=1 Tax=Rhizodiscina lignyota TaxID=1504668 RepID=A0A9P4M0P0_9PEZI|nr:NAD(P)-binding protein [Rhizodiscina lignyota]
MDPPLQDLSSSLPPTLTLANRNAIVTGASRGIGTRIATFLASRGANVAMTYTNPTSTPAVEELANQIRALGREACIIRYDLELPDCGDVIVKEALSGLGVEKIHILVNNAALPAMAWADGDGWDPEYFDRVMRVNVRAPAMLVKAIVPHFDLSGVNRIVNICSINSRANFPGYSLYSASKAGVDSLTRTWAKELAIKYHCTVNSVLVGPTATPDAPVSESRRGAMNMATAEKRLGNMEDVAEIVAWIASEGSRWVNGDTIGANGGIVIQS